jgi:hypothetical protein
MYYLAAGRFYIVYSAEEVLAEKPLRKLTG